MRSSEPYRGGSRCSCVYCAYANPFGVSISITSPSRGRTLSEACFGTANRIVWEARREWPRLRRVLLLCQVGARFECVEDDADEQSFEAAQRFTAAFAFGFLAVEVGAGVGVAAGLGDRDPVQGRVQLPVAAAVESVPLAFS